VLPVFLSPVVTVISCRSDRATKAVFRRQAGHLRCEQHRTLIFPDGTAGGNGWLENACTAISALRSEGSEKAPVILVLPPQATLLKHLRIPRVDARKRARIVAFEAEQNIPCPLDEVVWDSMSSGQGKTTQDILLVTAKLDVIESLCAAVHAAGFAFPRIIPSSLALLAAFRAMRPMRPEPELLLHFDGRVVTLFQLSGARFAVRSLLPGDVATADPEAFAGHIASEATRSLLFFQRQCEMEKPVRLWLNGAGTQSSCFVTALEQRLKIPVQGLDGDSILAGSDAGTPDGAFELAGAAALQLGSAQSAVNLLPPRLRTHQRRRRRQPCLVAAALLALVAPIGPLLYLHGLRQAVETKTQAMDRVIAPLRMREERNRNDLERLAELERQIAAWQTVRDRRSTWLELLADLQDRLAAVEDVWFESMRLVPVTKDEPVKFVVTGRMLEPIDAADKSRPGTLTRVTALLAALRQSPFVATVENERFDGSEPGLLAFEFVLVTGGTRPL